MVFLRRLLIALANAAVTYPIAVVLLVLIPAAAGFAVLPRINVSTDLVSGLGDSSSLIRLTQENYRLFGEQDSLIVVLEFPEPPGEARRPFIEGLGEALKTVPDVRRVYYRFLDPEDRDEVARGLKHFLLSMNDHERNTISTICTPAGISDALRRNRNRLFLAERPFLQQRILEDPLELGLVVEESMKRRVGQVSFGDPYLFIASPDSTVYLIQVTPTFSSSNIPKGVQLIDRLNAIIPEKIAALTQEIPGAKKTFDGLKWQLTGKTAFHYESEKLSDRELALISWLSFVLVFGFLVFAYRSVWSVTVLVPPIVAAVGMNYGLVYCWYEEINPVVMGTASILFGLGTDYGVHLWGRFREELDSGLAARAALMATMEKVGPAVVIGSLTNIIALACLCFSTQPAMRQFGFVSACGLVLTLLVSLIMFPAAVGLIARTGRDRYPVLRLRFRPLSGLFLKRPAIAVGLIPVIIVFGVVFGSKLVYEKDLFKAFLFKSISSIEAADRISKKFHSNFSQPIYLSFDVDAHDRGSEIQIQLDRVLEDLMERQRDISTFDSISYLASPPAVRQRNERELAEISARWPQLAVHLTDQLSAGDLSEPARRSVTESFDRVGEVLRDACAPAPIQGEDKANGVQESWYTAIVNGKHRFLTTIRYADTVSNPDELKAADRRITDALKAMPVEVHLSGTRQAMEEAQNSLVSELFRLGLIGVIAVVVFFLIVFRHPVAVGLSLIPMAGALMITFGVLGAAKVGVPFSIVGVAPLVFGLGIDNGIHIVMRSFYERDGTVAEIVERTTPMIVVTSITNCFGFLAMVVSQYYSLAFFGWTMTLGLAAAVTLTVVILPALLLIMEKSWRGAPAGGLA